MKLRTTRQKRIMRHRRIRAVLSGTAERPRLSVFRSNRHLAVQLIDDQKGRTILAADDRGAGAGKKKKQKRTETRTATAEKLGAELGKKAVENNITHAVFDRGGYRYHGLVKAIADGARKAGLTL